jgi:hypothetical protein
MQCRLKHRNPFKGKPLQGEAPSRGSPLKEKPLEAGTLRPGQRRGSGSYTTVFEGAGMSKNEEKKHHFLRKKVKNNGFFSQKVSKIL